MLNNKVIISLGLISTLILGSINIPNSNSKVQKPSIKATIYKPMIDNKLNPMRLKFTTNTTNTNIQSNQTRNNYSTEDLDLLARVIYAEVGDESDKAQLLVANVVMNRVESKEFPKTIRKVIYQTHPRQYECVANGAINKTPSAKAIKNAKRILEGERFCPKTIMYQSEFPQGSGIYEKIGTTYFCYDD